MLVPAHRYHRDFLPNPLVRCRKIVVAGCRNQHVIRWVPLGHLGGGWVVNSSIKIRRKTGHLHHSHHQSVNPHDFGFLCKAKKRTIPSCNLTVCSGKSPVLIGTSCNFPWQFSIIAMLNYQRIIWMVNDG